MPTAPHGRHMWLYSRKRRAFLCRPCKAIVPERFVREADLRADASGGPLDAVLDRLVTERRRVHPS